jgi:hypothetical protein
LAANKSYSLQIKGTESAREYFCWNKKNAKGDPSLESFICPNNALCSGDKIVTPDYGPDVIYLKQIGLQQIDQRNSIIDSSRSGAPSLCQFWVKPSSLMTPKDILWLEFYEKPIEGKVKVTFKYMHPS